MIMLKTEVISPHPKNPRKDLGDLTELTDSIRTFGVLQNLTVVPDGTEGYVCLCGHRRLAAAEAAGLEEVPCIIVAGMDEKTQVSIMLMENMQRSNLTVLEEAQGMQMMLDLGASIADIVKETGLSESKVRHRVKMNELDPEILQEKLAGQVSINDLIRLEQIKDIDTRNAVLEDIGTNNFEWCLKRAIEDEKREETTVLIKTLYPQAVFADGYSWQYTTCSERLKAGAEKTEVMAWLGILFDEEEKRGQDALIMPGQEWFTICFEPERDQPQQESEEEKRRREEKERKSGNLNEMRDRIYASWDSFMTEYCLKSESVIRKNEDMIVKALIEGLMGSLYWSTDDVAELLGEDHDNVSGMLERTWATMAALAYQANRPGRWHHTWNRDYGYSADEAVPFRRTSKFLSELGYPVSDDEKAFIEGRSELYSEGDEDD